MSNWYISGLGEIGCLVYYSLDHHKNSENLVAMNNNKITVLAQEQGISDGSYCVGLAQCIANGNITVNDTGSYYTIYEVI